jgi:GNAT superfamily N-acetyltransferase
MREIAFAPGDRDDRGQIIDLLRAQLEDHDVAVSTARLAAAVDGVLEHPERGFFHVARTGRTVIGVAYVSYIWSMEHMGKSAWLDELYVDPDYRGEGVGSELLFAAMDRARREGCIAMDLEVTHHHARAEGLYRREGFRQLSANRWQKKLTDRHP